MIFCNKVTLHLLLPLLPFVLLQSTTPAMAAQNTISGIQTLAAPAKPINISSPFGWRTDPINGQSRFHAGIDLPASTGTPVLAAQSGYVVFSGPYGDYGQAVVLDHGATLYTLYGHNSERLVSPGQYVVAGQPIALAGATGRVTGPHVHFEVHYNKQYLNPVDYLGSYFQLPLGSKETLAMQPLPKKDGNTLALGNNPTSMLATGHERTATSRPQEAVSQKPEAEGKHGLLQGLFHHKPKLLQHVDPKERIIPLSWDNNGPSSVIGWRDSNASPPVPGHHRVQMVTGNQMETLEF